MSEKLITVRDAAYELGLSEKKIIELAQDGTIPSYKLGDEFLRFRKGELVRLKHNVRKSLNIKDEKVSLGEKIYDLFYFNDFYMIAYLLIAILVSTIIFL